MHPEAYRQYDFGGVKRFGGVANVLIKSGSNIYEEPALISTHWKRPTALSQFGLSPQEFAATSSQMRRMDPAARSAAFEALNIAGEKKVFLEKYNCLSVEQKAQFQQLHLNDSNRPGDQDLLYKAYVANRHGHGDNRFLFFRTSLLNHSCQPTAVCMFDESRGILRLVAIRDIQPCPAGSTPTHLSEITYAYEEGLNSRNPRRTNLFKTRGFQCFCSACSLMGDELIESNNRRVFLQQWFKWTLEQDHGKLVASRQVSVLPGFCVI